jgi:tetratricopeptide (TPR) repeat protein
MSYSKKMLAALHNEDLSEAQLMFEQALKKDDVELLISLASELEQLGFLGEAKQIYLQTVERFPEADELYLSLAEIAIEDGAIDEAFEYLEKIEKSSDNYVQALVLTADLYQTLEIPEVSEVKLEEAIELQPDEPLLTFALAELYYSEGKYDEAIREYAKLNPAEIMERTRISTFERIGSAYSMNGHFEKAVQFLEKALEEDEDSDDDLLFRLGVTYLQLHENQKGIMYLQQLRTLSPHYPNYQLMLGRALQEEEQLEEAQKVLAEGIAENPYQAELYQFASENAYRLHDFDAAEDYLLEAIELDELRDENLYRLTNLYVEQKRWQDVIRAFSEMENDEHPYANWNLAKAQNELENYVESHANYEKAYKELKDEPDFLKDYALFLREEGEIKQARELLTHYLHLEPADIEVASLLDDLQ